MVLEREGETGCWIQVPGNRVPGNRVPGNRVPGNRVPGNRVPGNRVPGNRARLAAGKDNMATITFGRSTVE